MKKNIWFLNHYATPMFYDHGDRHYWFAENLIKKGYSPTIFCASTIHNSDEKIDTKKELFVRQKTNEIPFVFVKTSEYKGNGLSRVKNMFWFYINSLRIVKKYANKYGAPDVIVASSGHLLTAVAGLKIARKLGSLCIVEIRDLWPESIIAYGFLKEKSVIAKLLYQGEKWIYKRADCLLFTMEGGKDYIKDKKWDKKIDLEKVHHINNGMDIVQFDSNAREFKLDDIDLNDEDVFKIVYTGAIRRTNNIGLLVEAMKYVKEHTDTKVRLIVYGDGNEREQLEKKCHGEKIENVIFKGRIEKKYIPYILTCSDVNILNYTYQEIWKYGGSQRKLFEYFASGKPVLSTITMGYDLISSRHAGISLDSQSARSIGEALIDFSKMEVETRFEMGRNARELAKEYDFSALTSKLIDVIESIGKRKL